MNKMNNKRIRTVTVNDRGQIVIPEDVRKDLGINKASTLVLIERNEEIVLKKESDILEEVEKEDNFWNLLSRKSLEKAWDDEDKIWDEIYKKENI